MIKRLLRITSVFSFVLFFATEAYCHDSSSKSPRNPLRNNPHYIEVESVTQLELLKQANLEAPGQILWLNFGSPHCHPCMKLVNDLASFLKQKPETLPKELQEYSLKIAHVDLSQHFDLKTELGFEINGIPDSYFFFGGVLVKRIYAYRTSPEKMLLEISEELSKK